ncbi:MAG TPA: hypothetical protein PKW33_10530 [Anaerolineaceae bacterium]|nr:hypothetical protein [Anaerolineaceae bacterium]HPN52013.1 hypothetical protein [Anaerolineaceae bacterium]
MKFGLRLCLLLTCLALILALPGASPVQASNTWTPGFYTGWISFNARLDTEGTSALMNFFVIEKYFGRGQMMVKVDDQGLGGVSLILPTEIDILDYGKISTSQGECTFSSFATAQTNYVHLKNQAVDVSSAFTSPLALASGIRFTKTNQSSFGTIQGCENAGPANLTAMKKAMFVTTGEMKQMEFTITFNDGQSVGGTCKITGWEKVTPIPHATGQGVRSLPKCSWRVFKASPTSSQGQWKK